MDKSKVWSVGITLVPSYDNKWAAKVIFTDSFHAEPEHVQGSMSTYFLADPLEAARAAKIRAEQMNIEFIGVGPIGKPCIYVEGDGEHDLPYPLNWRETAKRVADALDWGCLYSLWGL